MAVGGPTYGEDRSQWLRRYALAADWLEQGPDQALTSLLWTLSLYELQSTEPQDLVRLTPRNMALAVLALLLRLVLELMLWPYVVVLVMGGGWQTVAALLIAASLTLPRLPVPRRLWPFSVEWHSWTHALIAAASFLFPCWTQLWQQRLAACVLLFFSTMGFSAPADC
ncbi:hypothetical protein OEZ85_002958 [Tetradesmus obliquus]|uniref:Alkaline ceramidase n=1 Tax=Tetradesmus obliquus TaxID=3088 RepID=A0ABY8U1W2_TETOB|nr:hypothetical protein OEZ85_002958 [Tetradesmus obliquus]